MHHQSIIPTFGDPRLPPRFWSKVRVLPNDCWEWTGTRNGVGYGRLGIGSRTDSSARMVYAHRFAYEHLVGPIPSELESDHLCRNRACVNPLHIEPVTRSVNFLRSPLRQRNRGEANGKAKITAADVLVIRALRGKLRPSEVARWYGMTKQAIGRIQLRKRWAHIK